MTKTKGIYIFSASPFRQRAFAGFGNEMRSMVRQHWPGALYFASLSVGAWCLMKWANAYYHHSLRKDPSFYEEEARSLGITVGTSVTSDRLGDDDTKGKELGMVVDQATA